MADDNKPLPNIVADANTPPVVLLPGAMAMGGTAAMPQGPPPMGGPGFPMMGGGMPMGPMGPMIPPGQMGGMGDFPMQMPIPPGVPLSIGFGQAYFFRLKEYMQHILWFAGRVLAFCLSQLPVARFDAGGLWDKVFMIGSSPPPPCVSRCHVGLSRARLQRQGGWRFPWQGRWRWALWRTRHGKDGQSAGTNRPEGPEEPCILRRRGCPKGNRVSRVYWCGTATVTCGRI